MNDRELQKKLAEDIKSIIDKYEAESGMMVAGAISINRAGCSDSPPYFIYGIGISVRVNEYWTNKAHE